MQFFPGMSLADTITSSSQATPGPNVIFRICPRGIWLRTVAPKNIFGKTISSTYCDFPVTLSRPSLRGTDLPMMCSLFIFRSPSGPPRRADGIVYDRLGRNGAEVLRGRIEKGYGVDQSMNR